MSQRSSHDRLPAFGRLGFQLRHPSPGSDLYLSHLLLPLLFLPSHSSLSQPLEALEEAQVRSVAPLEQMEPGPGAPYIL